jgi:hypothetical protein
MKLTPEELDALLAFLERQWMPDIVQRAYDKLAGEQQTRQRAGQRLADLEKRLREAAAEPRPAVTELPPETQQVRLKPDTTETLETARKVRLKPDTTGNR